MNSISNNILFKEFIILCLILANININYASPTHELKQESPTRITNKDASLPQISLKKGNAIIKGKVYGYTPTSGRTIRIGYEKTITQELEGSDCRK